MFTAKRKIPERLLKEAQDGEPFAQVMLGYMFEHGIGVPSNTDAAREWYERAVSQKFPPGQLAMALLLSQGRGDTETVNSLIEEASNAGYGPARYIFAISQLYQDRERPHLEDAVELLKSAASLGYIPALYDLSFLYSGEEFPSLKDINLAMKYARQAAEAGSIDGAQFYGRLKLEHGGEEDRAEALKWLEKAAESGAEDAGTYLSMVYWGGLHGVEVNKKKGWYFLKKARRQSKKSKRSGPSVIRRYQAMKASDLST